MIPSKSSLYCCEQGYPLFQRCPTPTQAFFSDCGSKTVSATRCALSYDRRQAKQTPRTENSVSSQRSVPNVRTSAVILERLKLGWSNSVSNTMTSCRSGCENSFFFKKCRDLYPYSMGVPCRSDRKWTVKTSVQGTIVTSHHILHTAVLYSK